MLTLQSSKSRIVYLLIFRVSYFIGFTRCFLISPLSMSAHFIFATQRLNDIAEHFFLNALPTQWVMELLSVTPYNLEILSTAEIGTDQFEYQKSVFCHDGSLEHYTRKMGFDRKGDRSLVDPRYFFGSEMRLRPSFICSFSALFNQVYKVCTVACYQ